VDVRIVILTGVCLLVLVAVGVGIRAAVKSRRARSAVAEPTAMPDVTQPSAGPGPAALGAAVTGDAPHPGSASRASADAAGDETRPPESLMSIDELIRRHSGTPISSVPVVVPVAPPVSPTAIPEGEPVVPAPTLPAPSPAPAPPAPAPVAPPAPAPVAPVAPAPPAPAPPAPAAPVPAPVEAPVPASASIPVPPAVDACVYRMVAPVELTFRDGGPRVGVRSGTATFLKYQRLAHTLLSDLERARRL
jgi:hypothetical protein